MDSSQPTLLGAAWKHRVLFSTLVGIFIVAGLAIGAIGGATRMFSADALIVLQDSNAPEGGGPTGRFITEQVEIIGSSIVAESAAAVLAETPIDPPVTSDDLIDSTSIQSSIDSSLVFVTAIDEDPDRAIAMVNALAGSYEDMVRLQSAQSSDAALERIDAQLVSLEMRFAEVAGEIQAEHDANADLRELEVQAEASLAQIVQLQAELADASGEEAAGIRQEINDYLGRLDTYRRAQEAVGNSPGMLVLLAEQQQLIDRRTELLRSRDQIGIDAELAPGAVALVDTAEEASEFVESNTRRIFAVAAALGLVTAFGASYLLELRRRSFGDRLEPEGIIGAPLLADIPLFSDEGLDTRLPTRDAPRSAAAEGFRFAAASIQDSMRAIGAKSVMMVGATLGQGKSTTIVNTTMANARRGHSVLLIDCDFGNQDATRLLMGSEPAPDVGLIDVVDGDSLLGEATSRVVLDSDVSLDLLSRGGRSTVAANLLSAKESRVLFESAASKYDIVFVDAPPLLQVAYASTVARYVDALVVVVSHDSPMREVEELVKRLQLVGTPVLGYIYNRSPLRKEMTAVDGSLTDILGTDGDTFDKQTEQPWWQKIHL